ncbi:MAG: TlpA family protein disulfide reductase [Clostridiaceae bacterium]|nr:TlpA family protein disulfide reductase [Clostridiaceae bacterium]
MKKTITILLSLLILALIFSACSEKQEEIKNIIHNATKQNRTEDIISKNKNLLKKNAEFKDEVETTNQQVDSTGDPKNSALSFDNTWFFESIDFAGNRFNSQEYFANGKLTLVNIWATWCPPCKMELPDLGQLAKDFAEQKVQFLGIATDVIKNDEAALNIAKSLLSDSSAEYPNVIINEQIDSILFQNQIQSIPTTILFDASGNIIGDFIVGMRSYDEFSSLINSALDLIE